MGECVTVRGAGWGAEWGIVEGGQGQEEQWQGNTWGCVGGVRVMGAGGGEGRSGE